MGNYIKFWMAKMLVEIAPLLIILAIFVGTVVVLVLRDYARRIFRAK